MSTNKQDQAKAVYELWDVILQHRWRFVLPAFTVTALVLLGSLFLPRKYEATAHIERRNAPELIEAIRSGASESYMDPMQAMTKEIAGSHAIGEVMKDLEPRLINVGYINNHAELVELRSKVKQQLLVHREYGDTTRVQLRLELVLDDPNIAALIVNALVERYIKTTRNAVVDRANSSIAYYDELIAENQRELEKWQTQLGEFEQEHAMLLPEQPYSIQAQISKTEEQLERLAQDLERIESRRRLLRTEAEAEPATVPSVVRGQNPELVRLQQKMEELQDTIRDHAVNQRMTENHPQLLMLREQEAELAAKIDATDQRVITSTQEHPNPKRGELELLLTEAQAERNAVKEQIVANRKKIDELSAMSSDMMPVRASHRKLVASVDKSQKDVDYYQNMRRRAENYLTPETGDRGVQLEFLHRAEPLRLPVSPNLLQVVLVAGFLGMSAGALSVFLAHRTDESFRNARQLSESTTIPVLGSVSELITRQHRRVRKLRYSIIYPANAMVMASVLVMFAGVLYLDLEKPDVLNKIKERAKAMVLTQHEQEADKPAELGIIVSEDPKV